MRYRTLPVTAFQQNCSLVWCEQSGRGALIDPGGEPDRLLWAVEQEGVTVERILLTHGHLDHVGAAPSLARALGVPVEGPSQREEEWFAALPRQAQYFGLPHLDAFFPDRWLEGGEQIAIGESSLEVIATPGHTPGHIVFFEPTARLLFVGDVLFAGSIGRTDFPGSSQRDLLDAIHHRLYPLGDDVTFIPGHGPNSTLGHERRTNPFAAEHQR